MAPLLFGEKKKMANKFQKYLEQATDSTLVETHWEGIIACTDMIRAGEIAAKPALQSIRKRLQHENPHVVQHTLLLLDACVKNCGHKMHSEIATRDFMEEFKNLVSDSKYEEVKNKCLEMLQCWATAFANKSEYKMIVDTHNLMKLGGFDFPSLKEADAMFMAQVAPEWQDGPECYRCRSAFSVFTRKHHCRACGQIFCDKCSSRELPLPQFGIEKEVRVCETCYETKLGEAKKRMREEFFARKNHPEKKSLRQITDAEKEAAEKEKLLREKEEEDLALALAISQSEAEAKEKEKFNTIYHNGGVTNQSAPPASEVESIYKGAAEPEDPLARYLNRDYWQAKKEDSWNPTAPPPSDPSIAPSICSTMLAVEESSSLNADLAAMSLQGASISEDAKVQADETMKWCQAIREQVSVMDNRIRSNLARGRPVFNDSAIQDLFTRLTELHSHVLSKMHTLDEQRSYHESLQDHLANIGEARQAINELREEHERKRQERMAEEQRLRQAQMQQTLENMRIKKHTMLMEQREQALQRFQQQQQEMAMRRQQQAYYSPYAQPPATSQPPQQYYAPPPPQQQYSNGYGAPPQPQYQYQNGAVQYPPQYPAQQQQQYYYPPQQYQQAPPTSTVPATVPQQQYEQHHQYAQQQQPIQHQQPENVQQQQYAAPQNAPPPVAEQPLISFD
ncbi:unnamed protein product [Caenorhabditis angaria]|uniref:Hepatocyte growth factor-regulated tyrosine kinase substrate n=1 Tax=Caenorhabditis angaria TaxID=860376 RepID=A0A9P1IM60_9PELO|nr:unnamed protein product [Caenorhabditis angaria]